MREEPASGVSLRFYARMANVIPFGYSGKFMLIAFVATHVSLLCLGAWFALQATTPAAAFSILAVALLATLVGTALTLLCLQHLLRPIELTAEALRYYAEQGTLPALPICYTDTVNGLMADTMDTLQRLDRAVEELEHRDPLTHLSNRAGLLRTLAGKIGDGRNEPFAIGVINLDGLHAIALTYGQEEADYSLQLAVSRLAIQPQSGESIHRIDPARLALVMTSDDPAEIADRLAAIKRCLDASVEGSAPHHLTSTIGIALWPTDDRQPAALIDDAVVAVDLAQRRGRDWAFYSESTRRARIDSHQLLNDLRKAIDQDELQLHYQPVIDTNLDRVVAAEALVRWNHPRLGLLQPARFIALAESCEMIEQIGSWTLEEACRQHREWRECGRFAPSIAVNLSARQIVDPDLPARIGQLVVDYALPPGSLDVELTETSAASDMQGASTILQALRQLGIGISIDDFGTGYSCLSQLRSLPFDKLKIDREFVRDVDTNMNNRAICRALIALGKEMELEVLAEGVETLAEVRSLSAHGCSLFQGFYFHRPLPITAFNRLLDDQVPLADSRTHPVTGA